MTIQEALRVVVCESNNEYAKAYAKAGLELGASQEHLIVEQGFQIEVFHRPTGKMMVGQELKVQLLYVLSNLGGWRGERAKEVKKVLKEGGR